MKFSQFLVKSRNYFTKVKTTMYAFIIFLMMLLVFMVIVGASAIVLFVIVLTTIAINLFFLMRANHEINNIDELIIKQVMEYAQSDKEEEKKV